MRREDLKSTSCNQKFRFRPSNTYTSKEKIRLPITIKQLNNKEEFVKMDMEVYVIDAENIPLLCGRSTLKKWEGELNLKTNIMKVNIDDQKEIKWHESRGGHVVIPLYPDYTTEETVF